MDAAGVISHYVMDTSSPLSAGSDQPLTANSNSNTTFYLYGLGAIAEETNAWSYSLPDGTNTPRQLTNLTGDITLSARYTPCPLRYSSGMLREGDTLEPNGTGNFTFGYPSIRLRPSGQASVVSWMLQQVSWELALSLPKGWEWADTQVYR